MDCDKCPMKGSPRVYPEGSRVNRIERPLDDGKGNTIGTEILEQHDNDGQYDVVVVGMAPANEEIKEGRPFVGASGKVLRGTLQQMGVGEFYITNVLLCPIEEEGTEAQALKCCGDRVIEDIKGRNPKLTIALGDMPLKKLAPHIDYSITEVEGRVIPSLVGPLLPVRHPAYFWRRPDDIFDFYECIRSGPRFLSGNYEQSVQPTLTVVDKDNLSDVLNVVDKFQEIGIDTETSGFVAYGWDPDHVLEMGIAGQHDHAYIVPREFIGEFKDIVEKKKGIYWNAQFDAAFLKQMGINPNVYFDGMLAHYTMDERSSGHGLKKVARIYLGSEDWEANIDEYLPKKEKKTASYKIIPTNVRYEYLAKDVTRTLQLKKVLQQECNMPVMDKLLMPAVRMFIDIQHRGIRVDPVKLMEMHPVLEEDMMAIEQELFEMTGKWVNPSSPQQVADLLYNVLGFPVDRYYGPSTGKEVLAQWAEDPIVSKIIEYRQINKMKGTYIEGFAKFVDRNYRIHPSIKIHGTVTGRLSSENPSIMNIPRKSRMKEIFLPEVDQVFIHGDVKGNELRWYYMVSGDEDLGSLFRKDYERRKAGASPKELDDYDPHNVVSTIAYGSDRAKDMRIAAKAVVFGKIYLRTWKSIARQVGDDVMQPLMSAIETTFPQLDNYYKMIMKDLRSNGYLESYFGRRRRFGLITATNIKKVEREAVNFPIQSAGSDLMLLNMLHLWENRNKWGIWPLWPVHDSITINAPHKDLLDDIQKELEEYSMELVSGHIPFVWEMDWGLDWSMWKGGQRKIYKR